MQTPSRQVDTKDFDLAEPRPAAMIESLRAFGYSLEAAVADLIDNSITASSRNVWIEFTWNGSDSGVVIRDDGKGMSEKELVDAMRLGNKDPLEVRDQRDLGRFGLGLKTASFSQCRQLTVLTKCRDQSASWRRWDLDYVKTSREWRLLKRPEIAPLTLRGDLENLGSGTFVIWGKLDRVVGNTHADDEAAHKRFLDGIDLVKHHLGMVFHRFLSDPGGLRLWLNGHQIKGWDPYLVTEPATQRLASEPLPFKDGHVTVQPYVLPHHSKTDRRTHESAAGPRGWNAQQGFYVYRNRRLLVAGDWLGLGFQSEEHYKLARIQVDIPNTMDSEWNIDVKKARARPPGVLKNDLKRIATATRSRAAEVYRHRGKVIAREAANSHTFVWLKKLRHGKIHYEINREHPLIRQVLTQQNGDRNLPSLLRLIEETIPVPFITMNNSERPDGHAAPFEDSPTQELIELMKLVVNALVRQGIPVKTACARAGAMEPFNGYPELIATVCDSAERQGI